MRQLSRSRILSLEFSNQLCNTCGWSSGVCHCCSRNSMVMQTGTNLSRSSWAKAKSSKDGSKASKACAKAVGDYWWCRLSLRMVTLRATESRPRCLLVCASSSLSRMPPVIIIGLQFAHALCSDYTTPSQSTLIFEVELVKAKFDKTANRSASSSGASSSALVVV
jgi:hypothetical protein